MEDDLEYFISFPTPKPYIESLNKKFDSKSSPKSYLKNVPSLEGHSLKKSENGHMAINLSSAPSDSALTTFSNITDSLDQSSLSSMNISSSSVEDQPPHDPDDISIGINHDDLNQFTTKDKLLDSGEESDEDDLLSSDDANLPYFKYVD